MNLTYAIFNPRVIARRLWPKSLKFFIAAMFFSVKALQIFRKYFVYLCCGTVAQSVERPSKGPRSWCNSTDVGSKHANAAG